MKIKTFTSWFLGLTLFAVAQGAFALASDKNQPMNIDADSLRHDDAKQVTIFSGNVVVTKGTIVLRGDTVTVQQRPDGSQFGVVESSGNQRAFFSQQRDTATGAPKETVEAEAQRIEYDSSADRVRLVNRAQLRRLQAGKVNDEISGAEVIYHNQSGMFTVDGAPHSNDGKGPVRVRAVIGANTTEGSNGGAKSGNRSGTNSLIPSKTLSVD